MKTIATFWLSCVVLLSLASTTLAMPTALTSVDIPCCDTMPKLTFGHELGNQPPFPSDEWITSSFLTTTLVACPPCYTGGPNFLVNITNMTTRNFPSLFYVVDPESSITNIDGFINGIDAFKIDAVGINTPLVSESIAMNGIFEAGETWDFIVQEYIGTVPPSLFGSIGIASASIGDTVSGASIVTPEPATMALLGLGGVGILIRRRRR